MTCARFGTHVTNEKVALVRAAEILAVSFVTPQIPG
jgi:hypothetical protein